MANTRLFFIAILCTNNSILVERRRSKLFISNTHLKQRYNHSPCHEEKKYEHETVVILKFPRKMLFLRDKSEKYLRFCFSDWVGFFSMIRGSMGGLCDLQYLFILQLQRRYWDMGNILFLQLFFFEGTVLHGIILICVLPMK